MELEGFRDSLEDGTPKLATKVPPVLLREGFLVCTMYGYMLFY